jgi:hypothetical protein
MNGYYGPPTSEACLLLSECCSSLTGPGEADACSFVSMYSNAVCPVAISYFQAEGKCLDAGS